MASQNMPLSRDRGAPSFSSRNPRELSRYLRDLEQLFEQTKQPEDKKKKWATQYLDVNDADDWEMLPEFGNPAKTWEEFKKAVIALYPGAADEERYTRADLDQHISRWRAHGITTLGDWAEFYRTYHAISAWLIGKQRLSTYDQGQRVLKVLDPQTLAAFQQRLLLKDPDHNIDDAYSLEDINRAASFVLRGNQASTRLAVSHPQSSLSPQQTHLPTALPGPTIKQEDMDALATQLAALTRRLDQVAAGAPSAGLRPRVGGGSPLSTFTCHYCGKAGHGLSSCPDVASDLQQGFIQKDQTTNRIVLPNGRSPPANMAQPGETMRQRVYNWHGANPGKKGAVAGQLLAIGDPEYQEDLTPVSDSVSANVLTTADILLGQVHGLSPEQQILSHQRAIESIMAMDGSRRMKVPEVVVPQPPYLRKRAAEATEKSKEKEKEREPSVQPAAAAPPAQEKAAPAAKSSAGAGNPPVPRPTPALHPFAAVRDATYFPGPAKVAVRGPPQANAPKTATAGDDARAVEHLFEKILQAPAPATTLGELFSSNPGLCRKAREAFTPKRSGREGPAGAAMLATVEDAMEEEDEELGGRVEAFELTEAPTDLSNTPRFPDGALFVNGAYVLPSARSRKRERGTSAEEDSEDEEGGDLLRTAQHSVPLRSLVAEVNHIAQVECIVDPGCQIVAMSEDVAVALGIACDPSVTVQMTSANGMSNRTLGIARDIPFVIGGLTLFFQVHVIREASYDILLGRPFDEFTGSIVQNNTPTNVTITIRDPNTGKTALVPTFERGKCLFQGRNIAPEAKREGF